MSLDQLFRGASDGSVADVQGALEAGVDATAKNDAGRAAIHVAAMEGHAGVVQLLLDRGVDADERNSKGATPMHHAAFCGQLDTCDALRCAGASVDIADSEGRTPFLLAAAQGHVAAMKWLVENGANARARAKDGHTALHMASLSGDVPAVAWLIDDVGFDVNESNQTGTTALHHAVIRGNQAVVEWLCDHGADVNRRDRRGWSAFFYAIMNGRAAQLVWLADHGADLHMRDRGGNSVLMASKIARKPEMTTLLKELLATPVAPPAPVVAARGPTWAVLRASPPRQGPGARRVTGLEVQHGPKFGLSGWVGHEVDEGGWVRVERLVPNTSYVARARAANGNGWGTASSRADCATCKLEEPYVVEAGMREQVPPSLLPPEEGAGKEKEKKKDEEAAPGPSPGEDGGGTAPSGDAQGEQGPKAGPPESAPSADGISPGTFRSRLASWQEGGATSGGGGDATPSPPPRRGPRRASLGMEFASTFAQRLASWQDGGAREGKGDAQPPPAASAADSGPRVGEVVAAWEARSGEGQETPPRGSGKKGQGSSGGHQGAGGGGAPEVPEEEGAALALCAASIPAEVPIEDVLAFLEGVVRHHGAQGLAAHRAAETGAPLAVMAVVEGRPAVLARLLQHGCPAECRVDGVGTTPLHAAAALGAEPCMRTLLAHGASVSTQDACGMNALHYAAIHEGGAPLRWLGEQGGDAALKACCAKDEHGRTPLHVAAQWGGEETVAEAAALTRRADGEGAALATKDALGCTPLGLCLRSGRARAAARLIRAAPEALEAEAGDVE